jgi:GNAT superfamily N-acetyltransferase
MTSVPVKIFYLQMFAHAKRCVPPREGLTIVHARKPTVSYYRYLYHTIGDAYHWLSRGKLSDAELALILQSPRNELHVLHVDGVPAGMTELDRPNADEIELVQFGLIPEFIGQGLGSYLLQWTIDKAWSYAPKRLWLHTCTLDHPQALPNYLKAGFELYKEELTERDVG